MTAYAIFIRDETIDKAELDTYGQKAGAAGKGRSMIALAAYGAFEVLEGPAIEGAVVLQFPTMADAKDWYDSPAYQEALRHRLAGAKYRTFIVEGLS